MLRRSGKGPVQVNDMEFASALSRPVLRLSGGVVPVDGNIIGSPLTQTNALAVLQVDCRKNDHPTPNQNRPLNQLSAVDL